MRSRLLPGPGAAEGWGLGLGLVPFRTRPPRLRPAGGSKGLLRHAERASISSVPQSPYSKTQGWRCLGWGTGATKGKAGVRCDLSGLSSRAQPRGCSGGRLSLLTAADPGEAQAGCGQAVGTRLLPVPLLGAAFRGRAGLPGWFGPSAGGQCTPRAWHGAGGPACKHGGLSPRLHALFSRLQCTHPCWPDSSQLKFS